MNEDYFGRNIIITGATSGIGKEAACRFAALGASKVILAARDLNKGEATKAALGARLGTADQLEVWQLDMMSFESVVAFAKRANELDHLDVAILNAGTRASPFHAVAIRVGGRPSSQHAVRLRYLPFYSCPSSGSQSNSLDVFPFLNSSTPAYTKAL